LLRLCDLCGVWVSRDKARQLRGELLILPLLNLVLPFLLACRDFFLAGQVLITFLLLLVLPLLALVSLYLVFFGHLDRFGFGSCEPLDIVDELFLLGKQYELSVVFFPQFGFLCTQLSELVLHVGLLLLDRVQLRLKGRLSIVHLPLLFL